VIFGTQKIMHK